MMSPLLFWEWNSLDTAWCGIRTIQSSKAGERLKGKGERGKENQKLGGTTVMDLVFCGYEWIRTDLVRISSNYNITSHYRFLISFPPSPAFKPTDNKDSADDSPGQKRTSAQPANQLEAGYKRAVDSSAIFFLQNRRGPYKCHLGAIQKPGL